jgi:mannitol-1-phosphate 5-dehydrogenase
MKKGKVVLFGAGATGRGHVGLLAWKAGYELVMVDCKKDLVSLLRDAGSYTVRLYNAGQAQQSYEEIKVDHYRVYHHSDREKIAQEIINADLVLTAVFDQNLQDVAKTLAMAVNACRVMGRQRVLNVIACENMMDSSSTLEKYVIQQLPQKDLQYCHDFFGFPDCMISRVVPRPDPDPLFIVTENYNEWTVRREAFKGEPLKGLEMMEIVDNQTARLERKLFIHNGGHAVCGYIGFHQGCHYVHEALANPFVMQHIQGAMDELGQVVQKKHGFSVEAIEEYKMDLARRGSIAELRDEILRVVRDPIRKLSSHERLVSPSLLAVEYGLPRKWIVKAIVAAFRYQHPGDPQSILLANMIREHGFDKTLARISNIQPGTPLFSEIKAGWEEWNGLPAGVLS